MGEYNKSYRIRTEIGKDTKLHVKLDREYDTLEIMSLKIDQINDYKLHTSDYGVIAGRVLANDAFGIPNAKVSVFISNKNDENDVVKNILYPYNNSYSKDRNGVKYNLLPNEQVSNCHTIIGTFPEKQYMLSNDSLLEVFDEYYKYTTRTNNAGDYMIFGVPTGNQTIHVDIDLSDIGILSQKPRDMVYKGYNIEQFENPNKFKYSTNLDTLTQVISQDNVTDVIPFWGDENESTIGITRCDISVQYKFEPTCVFIGSVVSDTASNAISKKCIPTPGMGAMDEITTGSGTIEMIRKTPSGDVEEYQIKGTQLINGDGVWCYQIPMNLDYIMTDEYGNTVPTNDPKKGIPTRTRVRFRISMQDFDSDSVNKFRCKMLVPHNPNIYDNIECENELDYNFGDNTKDSSYRDLFWNCVYSVKSYIPRIQKGSNWKNEKFTGFKRVNYYGDKNPIPYNNIRIKIPFMYMILCVLIKACLKIVGFLNKCLYLIAFIIVGNENNEDEKGVKPSYVVLSGELCDEHLQNLCVIPGINLAYHDTSHYGDPGQVFYGLHDRIKKGRLTLLSTAILNYYYSLGGTISYEVREHLEPEKVGDEKNDNDTKSIDKNNYIKELDRDTLNTKLDGSPNKKKDPGFGFYVKGVSVTSDISYFITCIEMNLAKEYRVIQFDFYNDWINGLIYIPRWERNITKKRTFIFKALTIGGKVKACNEQYNSKKRNIVQQCGVKYELREHDITNNGTPFGCKSNKMLCHKDKDVRLTHEIFKQNGIVKSKETIKNQFVYYFKPCEIDGKNVRLFSTDIILLGHLDKYNQMGIPSNLEELTSSSYQMPPNIALTDSEIEGDLYDAWRGTYINSPIGSVNGIYFYYLYNTLRCNQVKFDNRRTNLESITETGNYTEISGINWNYSGPLQKEGMKNPSDKYYTPGGHFLGLSCRNSETTIKTCVNLTRICEYGVWMSQRQSFEIPSTGSSNEIKTLTIIPSGIISKDEISGTNYRSSFASMNHNRLRTIKDNNNYLKYDFKYVYPNGFAGELSTFVYTNSNNSNNNRYITDKITEKNYGYTNNDYILPEETSEKQTIYEDVIMRTGEYNDKEYYNFRFGIKNSSDAEKRKRFLNNDNNGGIELVSFPMYDNSFYFYFGLHDGKTALDEFKKNYYSKCEKNNLDASIYNDLSNYLTIESLEDSLEINFNSKNNNKLKYSLNGETWRELNGKISGVKQGEKVYFKANNLSVNDGIGTFTVSKKFNLSGNVMSMLFGDEAEGKTDLTGYYTCFMELFKNCTQLVKVSKNFLPATTLADWCYYKMFDGCTLLVQVPELPATTLATYCYHAMFLNCSSLVQAPTLPATTLAEGCYDSMFAGCTSLVTAPALPATTLADGCYKYMFSRCNSMKNTPVLSATTLAKECYKYMFNNCNNLENIYPISANIMATDCCEFMFNGCTSLVNAPALPATTLADGCYASMFQGCTSLVITPELPVTTLAESCYQFMFNGCTSLVTAPELPATTLAKSCYNSMFAGCTSLVTAPELPATTLADGCYGYMFSGCTSLVTAPALPATTLVIGCYESMFQDCKKLNYIKALFDTNGLVDGNQKNHTENWVSNVSPTGTFIGNLNSSIERGVDGIPEGWNFEYDASTASEYLIVECTHGNCRITSDESFNYKTNNSTWLSGLSFSLSVGNVYYIKGIKNKKYDNFKITQQDNWGGCNLSGNIMALYYPDNPKDHINDELNEEQFKNLFSGSTAIVNVSRGFLPFINLAKGCYESMFAGCTSLETAPELPATTLADYCYNSMFYNCTSLVNAPVLPATTLAEGCYESMFYSCDLLEYIKMLATDISASYCLNNWVYSVSSPGTFVKSKDATWDESGVVPKGWNVETV